MIETKPPTERARREKSVRISRCDFCGGQLPRTRWYMKQVRAFCSDACKVASYRRRKKEAERRARCAAASDGAEIGAR